MHFLAFFSVVVLAISNHVEGSCLDCHLLKMVPAKWSRNGHDVRTLPLKCYVTEEKCSVDFLEDILTYNHTVSHHRCNPTDYCDIDVYFKCPSNKYSLGKLLCVLFHPSTISFFLFTGIECGHYLSHQVQSLLLRTITSITGHYLSSLLFLSCQ